MPPRTITDPMAAHPFAPTKRGHQLAIDSSSGRDTAERAARPAERVDFELIEVVGRTLLTKDPAMSTVVQCLDVCCRWGSWRRIGCGEGEAFERCERCRNG